MVANRLRRRNANLQLLAAVLPAEVRCASRLVASSIPYNTLRGGRFLRKDEALGLFLRCLGAWELAQGFVAFPAALIVGPAGLFVAAPQTIVGAVLFFGAGYFVGMTYGPPPDEAMDQG